MWRSPSYRAMGDPFTQGVAAGMKAAADQMDALREGGGGERA